MLKLQVELLEEIYRQVEKVYPEEGCGFLVGILEGEDAIVSRIQPALNSRSDSRQNRYLISPEVFLQVNKEVEKENQEIIGFYHSHPDVPASPSEFDREHAWYGYIYLIVPVRKGRGEMPQAWRLTEDRQSFLPESFILLERRNPVWQR